MHPQFFFFIVPFPVFTLAAVLPYIKMLPRFGVTRLFSNKICYDCLKSTKEAFGRVKIFKFLICKTQQIIKGNMKKISDFFQHFKVGFPLSPFPITNYSLADT